MHIELNEQERLRAQQGQPLDVTDPQTNEAYVLIARQRFEQMNPSPQPPSEVAKEDWMNAPIAEGIRLSQEAFRRDLPALLQQKKLVRQWAAYHRTERIGIGPSGHELVDECFRRGLRDDEFYVGWIDPCELIEEEEIAPRLTDPASLYDEDS